MLMIYTKKSIEALVSRKVHSILEDITLQRQIAFDYLMTLKQSELNLLLEAVDLKKQSENKLAKLQSKNPDVDVTINEAFLEQ